MVNLMYHDIVTSSDKSSGFQNESAFQYKVEKTAFEEQIKALQGKDVVFTFDDGGESFINVAAPILEKYGFKGVFFIATDSIGTPGFLDAIQIKELDTRGHIIGSHSSSHPHNMSLLSDAEIEREWGASITVLEKILCHKVEIASIPNGYSSSIIIEKAKSAGIRYLYTSTPSDREVQIGEMHIIGRYVIHDKMTTDDVVGIVNSGYVRKMKYLKWGVLEVLKGLLGSKYDRVKSQFVKNNNLKIFKQNND